MSGLASREKSSTIKQLEYIMDVILRDREPVVVRDHAMESLTLVEEWIEICREINIPFYVTLMDCEEDVYALVISQYPLTGGDTENVKEKYVEFRDHKWKQRTWVPYFADWNNKASWVVFTYLGEYMYYIDVPEEVEMAGIAESKKKYAPILWVAASDGQCEAQEENIRHSMERDVPIDDYIIQAEQVYTANAVEKALSRIKTLTQEVESKGQTYEDMRKNAIADGKKEAREAIKRWMRTQEVQREGLSGMIVNLFSNKVVKYIFWAFIAILIYCFVAALLNAWLGGNFLPTIIDMAGTGGNANPYTPTPVTGPVTTTPP